MLWHKKQKKTAPFRLKWSHLAVCDLDELIFNTFIKNFVRLSQIKKEFQNLF